MRLDLESNVITPPAVETGEFVSPNAGADFQQILTSGIAAAQSGDRLTARKLLFQASGIDPRCEDIWMWLASISDYPEELLIFLGNALEINPENQRAKEWRAATRSLLAKTFVQRAVAAHEDGTSAQAEQCIEQALTYDKDCESAWLWKASFAMDEKQKVEYLQKVLEIDPDNPDAQTALDAILTERSCAAFTEAKSAAVAGRRKKALELVNEFLRSEPRNADAWILRSHLSLGLGEKIESLQSALEIDPENSTARSAYDFLTATVGSSQDQTPPAVVENESVSGLPAQDIFDAADKPQKQMSSSKQTPDKLSALLDQPLDDLFNVSASPAEEIFEPVVPSAEPIKDVDEAARSEVYLLEDLQPLEIAELPDITTSGEDPNIQQHDDPQTKSPTVDISLDDFPEHVDPVLTANETVLISQPERENGHTAVRSQNSCPYCQMPNEPQSFSCESCNAVLSLSDIESLLNNPRVDRETIQQAVTQMEAEWNLREFSEIELTQLGIGYFNLGNYDAGVKYIQEAFRQDPNNVILSGQLNTIAIRLDEMRRQNEVHDAMPKGKTILVVDDSATVRKLISSKLEKSGHHVVCAEDGVEALECLEAGLPDLVLLDISMPRMDGYEVCKQIRTNPASKDLPVIMISGKDGFFDKVRGRMAGSTGYVTKPFGPETLMKALETYLLPELQITD